DEIPAPRDLRDWSPLPEEMIKQGEFTRYLDAAVLRLPENLRFVFILRDIHEMSIAETAELLGITEANTKVRLLRARLKLRELLSEYFSERIERR
ncbi:MAG TPA: sigma-70 family RNA polymerase sigma factor, partial [Bellilinea sp.]|nr:sigma-70 family RNA polymerase sigma factor [Bellilinea sp.]